MSQHAKGSHTKQPLGLGVVALVTVITVLTNGPVFLPGAASKLISKDIGLRPSHIGLIITLYWASSILGAFISRHAKDGASVEHRIALALMATAASLIMGGFWPEVGLWLGGAVGGFVYGYTQPHTNYLLIRRCATRIRGLAFGVKQAGIPIATLLFSVAVPIVAEPPGWRLLLIAVGVLALVVALALLNPEPADGGSTDTGNTNASAGSSTSGLRLPDPQPVQAARPVQAPRTRLPLNRHLLGLAIAGGCGAAVGNSLGGFLISSLTQSGGSLLVASMIASAGSITAIVVRIAFGVIVDRSTRTPGQLLALLFVIGAVGTALLAVPNTALRAVGGILAYGGGWGWAGLLHYEAGAAYPGNATPATAITQMGVSMGGAIGPLSFGIVLETYGPEIAWLVMTGVGMAAYLAVLLARRAAPSLAASSPTAASLTTPSLTTSPSHGGPSPVRESTTPVPGTPAIAGTEAAPPPRLTVWSIADTPFPPPGLLYAALETATPSQVTMWSVADLPFVASAPDPDTSRDAESTGIR